MPRRTASPSFVRTSAPTTDQPSTGQGWPRASGPSASSAANFFFSHEHGTMLLPIESLIHAIRGQKVMVDADLADLYGVPTGGCATPRWQRGAQNPVSPLLVVLGRYFGREKHVAASRARYRREAISVKMPTMARASRCAVPHAKHEFAHSLHEGMLLFNLISAVVEPHVVHGTLALTSDDLHNGRSNELAGGISRVT